MSELNELGEYGESYLNREGEPCVVRESPDDPWMDVAYRLDGLSASVGGKCHRTPQLIDGCIVGGCDVIDWIVRPNDIAWARMARYGPFEGITVVLEDGAISHHHHIDRLSPEGRAASMTRFSLVLGRFAVMRR